MAMSDEASCDFSVVAAQLVEAACFARDGDGETARAYIAHAMALLHRQPISIPLAPPTPRKRQRQISRGTLGAWQAQSCGTCRRQSCRQDSHRGPRSPGGVQRQLFQPDIQVDLWDLRACVADASAYRSSPGAHAHNRPAAQRDRAPLWDGRSVTFHPLLSAPRG